MARIRTIKPEFWQDEKLLPLSDTTRLVFLGLISIADDLGRLVYNPKLIEALLFDPDGPDRSRDVRESLANLSRMARVSVGKASSGQRILQIVNWDKHQKVDKPNRAAALPEIVDVQEVTEFANDSRMIRDEFATDSRPIPTTNDLLPTTNDLSPPRKRSGPKRSVEKAFPYFGGDDRARVVAAFRRLGDFNAGRVINAVGFAYRPASDPEHIPHEYVSLGVEDYCGLITKGRSAPFATPENCAKILLGLARNCYRYETGGDPVARADANMLAIHGHKMAGAA